MIAEQGLAGDLAPGPHFTTSNCLRSGCSVHVMPMPLRLHRAVSILSRSDDPGAPDAQSACPETAARIVMLEEALTALLARTQHSEAKARQVLAQGEWLPARP